LSVGICGGAVRRREELVETDPRRANHFGFREEGPYQGTGSYVKQFSKVLPRVKVARIYQIEHKLDAVVRLRDGGTDPAGEAIVAVRGKSPRESSPKGRKP
jgi:hypothetical protein